MSRPINISDSIVAYPSGVASDHAYASITSQSNGYNASSNTTYATISLVTGSGATTYIYYTFDFSEIPVGATIDSVSCTAKAYINTTNSSRITTRQIQLYTGTTAKGDAYTVSNSTTAFTMTAGTWTRNELQDARIRLYAIRGSSNTTSTYSFRFYGATFTVNYSINGTAYTVASSSNVEDVTITPATQELLGGNSATVTIEAANIDDIKVTDNDTDVTASLVQHTAQTGSYTNTFIPASFDSTNSVYNTTGGDNNNGVYSTNVITNGLTDHNSTTRCALYAVQGSGAISKMYYNFDCSSIPANATITSVSCQLKAGSQGSSYYSSYVAYLCSGTTTKTSAVSVSGSNSSPSTQTISGGSWTRADLNNIKILFQVTRGSSNTTTESTWSFFGATLTVQYTVAPENPYYWTYTLNNLSADHAVLVNLAGAFVPPEEDPLKTYYSLTISSINATTDPHSGTTRVEAGTNQTVTITPSDPQLILALDNGVDITSQLSGGIPSNTYTITTKVSGASYGFNLNSSTGYYVSTNNGVGSSASVARVNFNLESDVLVTIQYINQGESQADYGLFGKIDTTVSTTGNTYSGSSASPDDPNNYYYMCATAADSTTTVKTLTYNISAGQHYIDIKYAKDQASDSGNDSLQWKILSVEATSAGGEYTYTLSNISQKHSLIFVFGNVNYYFITSSGDNTKLFPDGQIVKLEGDNYRLTIVPNDINATVSITDNNVDRTSYLEYEEGTDKNNNTVVNYIYKLTNINAAHTLVVSCGSTDKIYLKINGTWTQCSKVYKKINGSWVEQSDFTNVFDSNTNYIKR